MQPPAELCQLVPSNIAHIIEKAVLLCLHYDIETSVNRVKHYAKQVKCAGSCVFVLRKAN